MEWYVPITIIPGIGLIISSTSSIMLSLNNEIGMLEGQKDKNIQIIKAKLSQLKKVSISIVFQYIGMFLFLISGAIQAVFTSVDLLTKAMLIVGVLSVSYSIAILLIYSAKAVSIRQKHLKL
jgi:hypothetical protein